MEAGLISIAIAIARCNGASFFPNDGHLGKFPIRPILVTRLDRPRRPLLLIGFFAQSQMPQDA
jgi:hypothetical protein